MTPTHGPVLSTFEGGSALSSFRRAALLSRLQQIAPQITALGARFVHLVATDRALDPEAEQRVRQLLTYGPAYEPIRGVTETVVVSPRLGTVSPWASKATDIAHSCGLDVQRVERITEFALVSGPLSDDERRAVTAALHDRMTQSVLASRDAAAALFDEPDPEPMERIDVLGDPTLAISRNFDVLIEEEGLALRGTFVINPEGEIKLCEIHDNGIGRDAGELLRKVQAAQYVAAHPGEVCPAKWTPGAETLSPSLDLIGKI